MVVFFFSFILFIYFLHPAQSIGDGGEFLTCGITLGITHPPGFPVYMLFLKLFEFVIPFGNPAYRLAVLNAVSVSFAFYLIYRKLRVIFPVLFMATTPLIVYNTSIHEVFPLLVFFVILAVFFEKYPLTTGFLSGIAASTHQYYVFLLPYFLFKRSKNFIRFLLCFAFGLTPHLYIPIRSATLTPQNIGEPSNKDRFFRYILRKDYGTFKLKVEEKSSYTPDTIIRQFFRPLLHFFKENMFFPVFSGIVFLYSVFNRKFSHYFFMFLLSGFVFLLVGNPDFSAETSGVLERFYILPFIFLVLFTSNIRIKEYVFAFLLIPNLIEIGKLHTRWDFLSFDYGNSILRLLKEGSYFFMDGGDDTFYTSMYNVFAIKKRQINLYDRGGVVFKTIYGKDFRKLKKNEKENRRIEVELSLIREGKDLTYSTMNENVIPYRLYKNAFLYSTYEIKNAEEFIILRDIFEKKILSSYRHRALIPYFFFMKGGYHSYMYASKIGYDVEWLKNNLTLKIGFISAYYLEGKDPANALKYLKIGLKISPYDYVILSNTGVSYELMGMYDEAIKYHTLAYEVSLDTRSLFNLAATYWKKGDFSMAKRTYLKILDVDPENKEALYWLGKLK